MSRWARVRWWGKWIGVVACAVIAVVWVGSVWYGGQYTWYRPQLCCVLLRGGTVWFQDTETAGGTGPPELKMYPSPTVFLNWKFAFETGAGGVKLFAVPLWAPLVLTTVSTWYLWRRDTRARKLALVNHCPKCGYDLAGLNAGSACPECGSSK